MSGAHALGFILLFVMVVLSLLMAVVVTSYVCFQWVSGFGSRFRRSKEQPQDTIPATALDSVSVLQLLPLSVLAFVGAIAAGAKFGVTGLLLALAFGLLSIFVIARKFNVMSQRVEVTAEHVDFTLVGRSRAVKASEIADVEAHWSTFPRRVTHITFHIRSGPPVVVAGNFVTDTELTVEFLDEARLLLGLDEPTDQPLPPSPQDAHRHAG